MLRILKFLLAGLLLGLLLRGVPMDAQNPGLAFGRDSVTGASVPISTDGSNALQVVGQ